MIQFERLVKVAKVFSITGKYLRYSHKKESEIVNVKSLWAKDIINHFKINIQIIGKPTKQNEPCLFVGNHISYLDIPILIHGCPELSFVSKKEVKSWPVIGYAAVKMQTIFIERSNANSRAAAKNQIATSLLTNKQKLAIFPSGTTSIIPTPFWKKGAFEIAVLNNIKVQPFRIRYEPKRAAAYIDADNFLVHMYQLFILKKIDVTLEFHEPVYIKDSIEECSYWKKWCEE
ncbi:MAG: 1-acyl-sn-glycerol-3-phosphate acyltransferase [Bacteriovorax sp.]|nr:1-acyl-sn-glycerol-3-phosphate acyltransferase [Bacteriovorax sp.]